MKVLRFADVVTAKSIAADAVATVKKATEVADDDLILDIGPETAVRLVAMAQYGTDKQVGYISTCGGAFLEIMEGKTLPALEILSRRALAD